MQGDEGAQDAAPVNQSERTILASTGNGLPAGGVEEPSLGGLLGEPIPRARANHRARNYFEVMRHFL
jgi:hypothetical protein